MDSGKFCEQICTALQVEGVTMKKPDGSDKTRVELVKEWIQKKNKEESNCVVRMSRKRSLDSEESKNKLAMLAVDAIANELVCPITQELPSDPVTAEDGRIYERKAIEKWLAQEDNSKSPITNELMGKRLLPALQVLNSIRHLVNTGAILGDKADSWKERIEQEEIVSDLKCRAETDPNAMLLLGKWYSEGMNGLVKDDACGFKFFKRAYEAGDVGASTLYAVAYLDGRGVDVNYSHGFISLVGAANAGSEQACYRLGAAYKNGSYGLKQNFTETEKWFVKMQDACKRNSVNLYRILALQWLIDYNPSKYRDLQSKLAEPLSGSLLSCNV